jgi:hypothetical protein
MRNEHFTDARMHHKFEQVLPLDQLVDDLRYSNLYTCTRRVLSEADPGRSHLSQLYRASRQLPAILSSSPFLSSAKLKTVALPSISRRYLK